MADSDEKIILELQLSMKKAADDIKAFGNLVREVRQEIIDLSKRTGESLDVTTKGLIDSFRKQQKEWAKSHVGDIEDAMRKASEASSTFGKAAYQALSQVKEEAARAQSSAKSLVGGLSALANVARFVFASVLGITAISTFRSIINYIKDATESALEFAKSLFGIEMGVRALQRAGTDIGIKDVIDQIDKLQEKWGIFSKKELAAGTADLVNLTRSFGFTKEQIFKLQDAIATLAVVNGKSMEEVQRTVALAISSGYTEGLQRLGVSMNVVTIGAKAQELGFKGNYRALTEVERAMATYAQLLEKVALYADDAKEVQDQLFGRLQKAEAELTDFKKDFGETWVPVKVWWKELLAAIAHPAWDSFLYIMTEISTVINYMLAPLNAMYLVIKGSVEAINTLDPSKLIDGAEALKQAVQYVKDFRQQQLEQYLPDYFGQPKPALGDVSVMPKKAVEQSARDAEKMVSNYESAVDDILSIQEDYEDKVLKMETKLQENLAEVDEKYADKRADIWEDYWEKVADLNRKYQQDLEKEARDFAFRQNEIRIDAREAEAEAIRKFHENELKAERDYQERLRRLKEEYLFDLEEALRQRDVLQIIRLQKRYALDKEQLAREQANNKIDRSENLRNELEEIRRNEAKKLQELKIAYDNKLAELHRRLEKELHEAEIAREQDLENAKADWEKARAERQEQYDQDLKDLRDWLDDKLTEFITNFGKQEGVTDEMTNKVADLIKKTFAKKGTIDKYFTDFNQIVDTSVNKAKTKLEEMQKLLKDLTQQVTTYNAAINGVAGANYGNIPTPPPSTPFPSHASGASFVATSPQLFMAGEVPERLDIVPLSRLNSQKFGGSGESKGTLRISLSEGLEAQIIDNTLNQFNIVLSRELSKK